MCDTGRARAIYDAGLDAAAHAAMSGGEVTTASTEIGGASDAWGDYISAVNVTLEPGRPIVETWSTTNFTLADPDSQIEVIPEPAAEGTRLTLTHTNVPDGH